MPGALSEAITAFIDSFDAFWQIWSEPGPLWVIGGEPPHVSAEDRARYAEEEELRKLVNERGTSLASLLANKHHKSEAIAVIDLLHAIEQSDDLAPKWRKLKPALQYLTMAPERDADPIEQEIAQLLLNVPETWTEFDRDTHSELRERAHFQLIAAGMIEQRSTFRLRMFGNPVAVEATITLTGEGGFAEAMEPVLADIWHDWKETFEQRLKSDLKDAPGCHCERIGKEQWRLTAEGIVARNDLGTDKESSVFDFVLKRGFFDGQPRMLRSGKISQRLPVAGSGKLERMVRVGANAGPAGVSIANWNDGAQLFASAFAELLKVKEAQSGVPATAPTSGATPGKAKKQKRSTARGDGRIKIIAALSKHHQYANESCLNLEPIGNNELAKAAVVAASTVSSFFNEKFHGHGKYKALCRDAGKLVAALKMLNGEFAPHILYGSTPQEEGE